MQVPYYLKRTVVQPPATTPRRHSSLGSTASFESTDLDLGSLPEDAESAAAYVQAADTAAEAILIDADTTVAAAAELEISVLKSNCTLLRGEVIANEVRSVLYSYGVTSTPAIAAKLLITNFRLWLQPPADQAADASIWLPIACVRSVQISALQHSAITVTSKDLKALTIALPQTSSELFVTTLCSVIRRLACPGSVTQLFALAHGVQPTCDISNDATPNDGSSSSSSSYCNGWQLYDVYKEYARQGLIGRGLKQWRMYDNSTFETTPSYPHTFVVPAATTDRYTLLSNTTSDSVEIVDKHIVAYS
jgi:Myotubularin-like phosphatase domain